MKKGMTMKFAHVIAGTLLAGAILAGPASANQQIQIQETALGNGMYSGSLKLPVPAPSGSTRNFWSGFQSIDVTIGATTSSFLALCVNPSQWSPARH